MPQSNYTQLSLEERIIIQNRLENHESIRCIAKSLRRSPSTIAREIKRNSKAHKSRVNIPHELYLDPRHYRGTTKVDKIRQRKAKYYERLKRHNRYYQAKQAQTKSKNRVKQQKLYLLRQDYIETLSFVKIHLKQRWSPEQIAGRLKLEGRYKYISHKAIYRFIYLPENKQLIKYLRRRGKRRYSKPNLCFNQTNRTKHNIAERPEIINSLTRYGDLEGDTIFGKDTKDRILTHVERKSGLLSASLVRGYNSHNISKQTIIDTKRVFGANNVKSITYDNGVEFSLWQQTEEHLETMIYFANPYHSWERGRNENANGLIRDFYPKGTDFKRITKNDIMKVESLINNRPRKRLGWKTPLEVYRANVALEGLM